jgi:hypothetical protein
MRDTRSESRPRKLGLYVERPSDDMRSQSVRFILLEVRER